ncbi:MAG: hypothetical protein U0791_03095 [Gemmataceae bacterium]
MEFVFPKDFKGHAWIILDPASEEIPFLDGLYRVMIPQDGVLRVKSFRPFEQWHESRCRYNDGTTLRAMHSHPDGSDKFGLWFGGRATQSGRRDGTDLSWIEVFVGTGKEFRERTGRPPGFQLQ